MADKQKTTQKEPRVPFENMPFVAMMQKMMGRQGQGCDCAKMMSQMMSMCGGAQDETKADASEDRDSGGAGHTTESAGVAVGSAKEPCNCG